MVYGRKIKKYASAVIFAAILLLFASTAFTQSTNLEFPTPVTSSEIRGRIKARDVGDSRLTSHYYLFEAENGDVLLNIESSNLNGDIDVYTAGSLKPLLKASVYAVDYATAMQRQIYLRLPSRLILRVEGRTPNDEPADYRVKFSGVFKPIAASSLPKNPGDPKVTRSEATEGAVSRVSSVGTIIEEIKPPPPKEEPKKEEPKKEASKTAVAKNTPKNTDARERPKNPPATTGAKPKPPDKAAAKDTGATKEAKPKPPPSTDAAAKTEKKDKTAKDSTAGSVRETGAKTADRSKTPPPAGKTSAAKKPSDTATTTSTKTKSKPVVTVDSSKPAPDPLAGIFLVIRLKDDTYVRYEMTMVERVGVNNGVLTVVLKNGGILRRPLLEVAEVKIGQ